MLEKLIDDELLMIKSKELKIKVSNREAKAEAKKQRALIEDMENDEKVKAAINGWLIL